MIRIEVDKSLDAALKKLKFKFDKSGIKKDLWDRQAYEKPSVTKRLQKQKAAYKQKRSDEQGDI
jgi:small subunit ribosomal protein S21